MAKTNVQLARLLHEEGVINTRTLRRVEEGDYPETEEEDGEQDE